ncbi:MAG: GNAT family N-acetyltransferase [Pseudomonadota bacterium]
MAEVKILHQLPDPDIFRRFRAALGWGEISHDDARRALDVTQLGVVAQCGGVIVGFGRVTGDGVMSFHIEDVIVADDMRGQGIGRRIVGALVAQIEDAAAPGSMISLQAAEGKERFYEGFGFSARPKPGYGAGMMRLVKDARMPEQDR